MKDLIKDVIDWAGDKGLLENATPISQYKKTMEEVGELEDFRKYVYKITEMQMNQHKKTMVGLCELVVEITANNIDTCTDKIKKNIGVVVMSLIIQCEIQGLAFNDEAAYTTPPWRFDTIGGLMSEIFREVMRLGDLIQRQQKDLARDVIGVIVEDLVDISHRYGLTLEACLQSAYDATSNRTGKMVGGTLVKDSE